MPGTLKTDRKIGQAVDPNDINDIAADTNAANNRLSGLTIDSLVDVSVPSPSNGYVVTYDATQALWVAKALPTTSSAVSSVNAKTGVVVVTKADVGLDQVANTSDADKPASSAVVGLLAAKADLVGGKIPTTQLPSLAITEYLGTASSNAAMLALAGQRGDFVTRTDTTTMGDGLPATGDWILTADNPASLSSWHRLVGPSGTSGGVTSVAGKTGPAVTLAKGDVGLDAVDNTSDLTKPISNLAAAALGVKANDNAVVHLVGDENVGGVKSLANFPLLPSADPTTARQAVHKSYVDAQIAAAGGGGGAGGLSYSTAQVLTSAQKARARLNAGAVADGAARFHVADYGAVGDGVADDRPAFAAAAAAAIAYITANSADAILDFEGMGVCLFNSGISKTAASVFNAAGTGATIDSTATDYSNLGIPIPPALPGRLTFAGQGTKIRLTTNCVCFAFPDKTRDYQVWQNLYFDRVVVDDNNIVSTTKTRGHVIFGNAPAWGVKYRYTSAQDIYLNHCVVLNAATDTSTNVGAGNVSRSMFWWSGDHNGPSEATQTFTRRITTAGGYMQGGDQIYAMFSTVADRYRAGGATLGGVNHFYDEIHIGDGWRHVNNSPMTQQRYQTSVYIGGSGKGDRFSIGEGYSDNIGDDVIEIGGMLRGVISKVSARNPFFNLVLFRNTGPIDSNRQMIECKRTRTEVTPALSGTTGAFAAPFAWIADDLYLQLTLGGTVTGGTFTLTIPLSSGSVTTAAIAYNATAAQVAAAIDAVVPAVNTSGPGGGLTAYAGAAVNSTAQTTVVLVKQSLANNGRVTATSSLTGTNPTVTVGLSQNGTGFGRFRIEDDLFIADGLTSSRQGRTDFLTKGPGLGVPILGIEIIRPKIEFSNYTYDGAASNWELFMLVHANSLYANFPLRLLVRDATIRVDGANLAAGSGTGYLYMVGVEGYATFADIMGIETDFSGSQGGTYGHVMLARNQGSGIRAIVSRLKPKGQPSLASYAGLRVGSEGLLTWARLTESDFSSFGNMANGLILPPSGTNFAANILATRASGNYPDVVAVPTALTANFTTAQAHSGAMPIQVNSASTVVITVAQLIAGSSMTYVRTGAGAVTLNPSSGLSFVMPAGATAGARVQGSSLTLTWLSPTSVLVEGDLG